MSCLLTVLTVVSSLQPNNTWQDIRVSTIQKLVVPQEEFVVVGEKMMSPTMKKTVTKTLVCGETVTGDTTSHLTLTNNK